MIYQKYYDSLNSLDEYETDDQAHRRDASAMVWPSWPTGVWGCSGSGFHQNRSISRFGTCPPQYCRVHEDLTHWEIIGERVINKATQH